MTKSLPTFDELFENYSADDLKALAKLAEDACWQRRRFDHEARIAEAQAAAAQALKTSPERRFKDAIKTLRRAGFKWHTNVKSCCRGCVTAEQLGLKDGDDETTQYGWTFGGQGAAVTWDEKGMPVEHRPVSRWDRPSADPVTVYVYHGNGSAAVIADAFREQGFQVDWDGSDYKAIEVVIGR